MKLTRRYAMFGLAMAFGFSRAHASTASRSGTAFGTTIKLTLSANDTDAALTAAFAEIRRVEKSVNLFDATSEVCVLNQQGFLANASPLMLCLLKESQEVHQATDAAFDPTVQSLWNLWSRQGTPDAAHVQATVAGNGLHHIHVENSTVTIANRTALLTFDGIARGLACDLVANAIKPFGATAAVLDTDVIGLVGNPDGAFPLEHPRNPGESIAVLHARTGFLATSGDYGYIFSSDFRNNHIYDPATGYSPSELSAVTVIAESGAKADALATAFMVMGINKVKAFLKDTPSVGAVLVTKTMELINLLNGLAELA